jgi:hypothetical protein
MHSELTAPALPERTPAARPGVTPVCGRHAGPVRPASPTWRPGLHRILTPAEEEQYREEWWTE